LINKWTLFKFYLIKYKYGGIMKGKTIFSILFIILLATIAVGCKKEPTVIETITPIADVLETFTNNQDVVVEGVMYGKTSTGFYISDSTLGKIFVTHDTAAEIGDKVKVTGVYGITSNMPRIKNVSKVVVTASDQTLPTPDTMTVEQVFALSGTAKTGSYAKYISLVVTLEDSATGIVLKSDEANTLIFSSITDQELLSASTGKRVTIPVILHEYNSLDLTWRVTFAGEATDVVLTPLSFDVLVTKAMTHINSVVPSNVYGSLVLPTVHPTINYLQYTWTVATNDYVSIDDNQKVAIVTDETDHDVVFTVTISNGEEQATRTVNLTSKAIIQREVSELFSDMPAMNDSTVILHGVVVAFTRNQSLTIRSIILKDMTTFDTISVDFADIGDNQLLHSSSEYLDLKLGDEIVVCGLFRTITRQTVYSLTSLEVLSSGNPVVHDTENAFVISTKEDYEELGNNYDQYSSKLVKFNDPFMNYSTSSTPVNTNWVRLGYSETTANSKHDGSHVYAILIAANDEATGSEKWHKMFEIPFVSGPAMQYGGYFYAYVMYVSDTYMAFVVPEDSLWVYENDISVEFDLGAGIPASLEDGIIILPTTHSAVSGNVVWTSSNEELISTTTGKVTGVEVNTVVTLTAVYTYDELERTSTYEVTILGTQAVSVHDLLTSGEDGDQVKVKGIFVAYQSDGNANVARDGIMIMDETTGELLLVNAMAQIGGAWGAYLDSAQNPLEFGHEVQIVGTFYLDSPAIGSGPAQTGRKYLEITANSVVKRISDEKKVIDWKTDNAIVVDSDEDLVALSTDVPYGQLIKFVGTVENPIYLGGSTSSDYTNINIKVFMNNATSSTEAKYNDQVFSFKNSVNTANAGETWLADLFGITEAFVGPSAANPAKPFIGTVYVVINARSSTYFQFSLVNYTEASMSRIYTDVEINQTLVENLAATHEAGPLGFTLPTTHPEITGTISWVSSDSSLINLSTNIVGVVSTDTPVTLTGTYNLYGATKTVEHVVLVMASASSGPKTVSALLSTGVENMETDVVGYLAAYQSDGNNNVDRDGFFLMDKTTGELLIVNAVGLVNAEGSYGLYKDTTGALLEIGQEVIVSGVFHLDAPAIGSGPAQTGKKFLEMSATSTLTRVSETKNTLPWDKTNAILIDEDTDLVAFAATPVYGQLIKIVGTTTNPIQLGGSSNTFATMNIKFFMNNAVDNTGTKYSGTTFAFKNNVNVPNASETWSNDLFGISSGLVCPTDTIPAKPYTGILYAVLAARTSTYFQLSIVVYDECSATPIS